MLAAGSGRRFGGDKMLACAGDAPLLWHALDCTISAPIGRLTVVIPRSDPLMRLIMDWDEQRGRRAEICFNDNPAQGLGSSLALGAARLGQNVSGAFIFLGDMPRIPANVAAQLAGRLAPGVNAVVPTYRGQPGHPVLISRALFPALRQLSGDRGARRLLAKSAGVVAIEIDDEGVLLDIDRVADLARMLAN